MVLAPDKTIAMSRARPAQFEDSPHGYLHRRRFRDGEKTAHLNSRTREGHGRLATQSHHQLSMQQEEVEGLQRNEITE